MPHGNVVNKGNIFMRNYAVHNPQKMPIVSSCHIFHINKLKKTKAGIWNTLNNLGGDTLTRYKIQNVCWQADKTGCFLKTHQHICRVLANNDLVHKICCFWPKNTLLDHQK